MNVFKHIREWSRRTGERLPVDAAGLSSTASHASNASARSATSHTSAATLSAAGSVTSSIVASRDAADACGLHLELFEERSLAAYKGNAARAQKYLRRYRKLLGHLFGGAIAPPHGDASGSDKVGIRLERGGGLRVPEQWCDERRRSVSGEEPQHAGNPIREAARRSDPERSGTESEDDDDELDRRARMLVTGETASATASSATAIDDRACTFQPPVRGSAPSLREQQGAIGTVEADAARQHALDGFEADVRRPRSCVEVAEVAEGDPVGSAGEPAVAAGWTVRFAPHLVETQCAGRTVEVRATQRHVVYRFSEMWMRDALRKQRDQSALPHVANTAEEPSRPTVVALVVIDLREMTHTHIGRLLGGSDGKDMWSGMEIWTTLPCNFKKIEIWRPRWLPGWTVLSTIGYTFLSAKMRKRVLITDGPRTQAEPES